MNSYKLTKMVNLDIIFINLHLMTWLIHSHLPSTTMILHLFTTYLFQSNFILYHCFHFITKTKVCLHSIVQNVINPKMFAKFEFLSENLVKALLFDMHNLLYATIDHRYQSFHPPFIDLHYSS